MVRRDERGAIAVLATAGGPIGGDRATELLIEDAVAPRLGSRAEWGPKRLRLPRYIVNALRDWHALSALNEKPLLDSLDDLVRAGAPRRELAALRSAIELQLGYEIFQTTDATKIDLSRVAAAILTYHHAEVDVDARVTRGRFEHLIRPMLDETATLVRRVTDDAGLAAADVAAVVYTGGSSAIPAFRALMRELLPNADVAMPPRSRALPPASRDARRDEGRDHQLEDNRHEMRLMRHTSRTSPRSQPWRSPPPSSASSLDSGKSPTFRCSISSRCSSLRSYSGGRPRLSRAFSRFLRSTGSSSIPHTSL